MIAESEFLSSCCIISESHLQKAFRALDIGKTDYIEKEDLQAAFCTQGTYKSAMPDVIWQ